MRFAAWPAEPEILLHSSFLLHLTQKQGSLGCHLLPRSLWLQVLDSGAASHTLLAVFTDGNTSLALH